MPATKHSLPLLLDEVEVVQVEQISPSFVRLELGAPCLADFGVDGPLYDQRIKLIFPHGDGPLPSFEGADETWFSTWLDRPVEERGHMRTYTVRGVRGSGAETRVVVDIVVHTEDHGDVGPGCEFAIRAKAGDRLLLMGPKKGVPYGGIEFTPGTARRVLLAGDETAVPAISAILEQLPADASVAAFLEVPRPEDVLAVDHPEGFTVRWLPRGDRPHGVLLHQAVVDHLGVDVPLPEVTEDEIDPDLWETPVYSSSGEEIDEPVAEVEHRLADLYAWIAGESKVVTGLRRALVSELGMDRRQVAFMGYWRRGVAMRS